MDKELVTIENSSMIFIDGGIDDLLKKIKDETTSFVPDTSTDKGRKQIASLSRKVSSSKVAIDNAGKALVNEWKSKSKLVDASRKQSREFLDNLRDEIRKPLSDWEQLQKDIAIKKLAVEKLLNDHVEALEINARIDKDRELKAREDAILKREAEEKRIAYEKALERKAVEAERIRAAQEKEKAEREKIELAQKVEDDRLEAIRKAEREKIEAENKIRKEAEEKAKIIENTRLAEIAEKNRIKAIADKKAANIKHQSTLNNEAMKDLIINGIDKEIAKQIIILIAKGFIKNITINY